MKFLLSVFLLAFFSSQVHAKKNCWCHAVFDSMEIGDLPGNGVEFSGDNETNCLNVVCLREAGHNQAMAQFKDGIDVVAACTGKKNGANIDLSTRARVGANGGAFKKYATLNCQITSSCPPGSWADSNFPGKCVSGVPNTDGIKGSGLKDQRLQNNEFFIWQGGLFKVSNTAQPVISGTWQ